MRTGGTLQLDGMNSAERRRWAFCFSICLAAHAVPAVIAAWWLGTAASPASAPPTAIMVDMSPSPSTPVQPQTEIPPGPVQQHIDIDKPQTVRHDKTPPVLKAAVALPTAQDARPNPQDKTPVRETTAPPSAAAPQASAAAPAPTAAEAPSNAAPTWQSLLLGRLEQFKHYPVDAQERNEQGVPYLRFAMDREGRVLAFRIEKSSGFASLDNEALALIQRAQPLPKPPPDVSGERIELVVPIEFFLRGRR